MNTFLLSEVFLANDIMPLPLVGERVSPNKVLLNFGKIGVVYRIRFLQILKGEAYHMGDLLNKYGVSLLQVDSAK